MTLEQLQDFLVNKGLFSQGSAPTISEMGSLSGGDIMAQYLENYNLQGLQDTIDPSIFQSIPLDMLLQQQTQFYSPKKIGLEQSAVSDLRQKASTGGKKAYGGFAGSGQAGRFESGVKDEYGKSMAGILDEIVYKPRASGSQALSDWTSAWDEAMINLSGTGV